MNVYQTCWCYFGYFITLKLLLLSLLTDVIAAQRKVNTKCYFTLSASGSIFSDSPYLVVLTSFNCLSVTSFDVSLSGPNLKMNGQLHTTWQNPTRPYVFRVPKIGSGTYWLHVKSLRGVIFANATKLVWRNFNNFVKIQTPKTLYRPGQLLQFTVFYHNEILNAIKPEPDALIWIEDAKGNRVRVYKKFEVTRGIFQSELRLSRQPNLGNWRICSQNGKRSIEECANIHVQDYELPSFEVIIKAPGVVYLEHGTIEVNVEARYTIDSPVDGNLTLDIETLTEAETTLKPILIKLSAELKDGKATLQLNLDHFKERIPPQKPLQLQLRATVLEKFSDKSVTLTESITLWGIADKSLKYIKSRAPRQKPINFIKVLGYGEPIKTTQKIQFQLDRKLKSAVCMIMCNGRLISSTKVFSNRNMLTFDIQIQFTTRMWPFVHVILHQMQTDLNILYLASQTITVSRRKHDHVFIEAPNVVTAGTNITFRIKSVANSYVGLTAVDNRVVQMAGKSHNDFTHDYFDKVKFSLRAAFPDSMSPNKSLSGLISGLIILSNAALRLNVEKEQKPMQSETTAKTNPVARTLGSPHVDKSLCCKFPTTIEKFNDVWIYDSIKRTKAGWTTWQALVPNVMTTWRLSAFSVDSKGLLTLLEPELFINIKSIKPILMSLRVPYSIRVGEILKLTLSCSSQKNEIVNAKISLKQDVNRFELLNNDGTPDSKLANQILIISSNTTNSITFNLRALKHGTISLTFDAESQQGNDSLTQEIEVLKNPKRLTKTIMSYKNLTMLEKPTDFELNLTPQPTEDGVTCFVSGPMMIGKLQKLNFLDPSDNCEQMISKMMYIYHLWYYMNDKNWLSPQYKHYLEDQLNDGFQSLLRLRDSKGGFKYYESSYCSSTWLTAYALQLLYLLQNTTLNFESSLISPSEEFVISNKNTAGHFEEHCWTPGQRKIEALELNIEVINVLKHSERLLHLEKALKWTNEQMTSVEDYHLLAKHGLDSTEWNEPVNHENATLMQKRRNLETAGLMLHRDIKRNKDNAHKDKIFNWLVNNIFRDDNNVNCYESSMAQMAIFEYLQGQQNYVPKLSLSIWTDPNNQTKLLINDKNHWQEQKVLISTQDSVINFRAEGKGQILIRCNYDYELNEPSNTRSHYQVKILPSKGHPINITCCVTRNEIDLDNYVGSIMELQLPSGYELDQPSVKSLSTKKTVQQAESMDGNTKLFANIVGLVAGKSRCLSVVSRNYHKLEMLQPGTFSIYDVNAIQTREVFAFNVTSSN